MLHWKPDSAGNKHGDSLLTDINAFQTGKYSVDLSCERFREQGPAEWRNTFWHTSIP